MPAPAPRRKRSTKLREDFRATTHDLIADNLPELVSLMMGLAWGIKVKDGDDHVYTTPPDRQAIANLMDRVLGKPMQAVEHSGKDGGAIQHQVQFYLPENNRDAGSEAPPEAQAQLDAARKVPVDAG